MPGHGAGLPAGSLGRRHVGGGGGGRGAGAAGCGKERSGGGGGEKDEFHRCAMGFCLAAGMIRTPGAAPMTPLPLLRIAPASPAQAVP